MSAKKNLPNIPIYIGDWMKDCAAASMEAQGAWLQIVFKLWTNGKQNSCKMRAKSLQKLWKCGREEMLEIIYELKEQDICPIVHIKEDGIEFYEITCRRFVKENKLSEIRKEAANFKKSDKIESKTKAKEEQNKSKSEAKEGQNKSKSEAKEGQIPDNDIDYDIVNNIEVKDEDELNAREIQIENCYQNCLTFFPEHLHPSGKQVQNWKDTIDKLNRIENIPFEKIENITQRTRADDFWSKNFLSLTKLRKKNKDQIMYVVVFNELFENGNRNNNKTESTINRQTAATIKSNSEGW